MLIFKITLHSDKSDQRRQVRPKIRRIRIDCRIRVNNIPSNLIWTDELRFFFILKKIKFGINSWVPALCNTGAPGSASGSHFRLPGELLRDKEFATITNIFFENSGHRFLIETAITNTNNMRDRHNKK